MTQNKAGRKPDAMRAKQRMRFHTLDAQPSEWLEATRVIQRRSCPFTIPRRSLFTIIQPAQRFAQLAHAGLGRRR